MQSSRSCRIVRELRINEIKHVQSDKPLSEFTEMAEKKKKKLYAESGIINIRASDKQHAIR